MDYREKLEAAEDAVRTIRELLNDLSDLKWEPGADDLLYHLGEAMELADGLRAYLEPHAAAEELDEQQWYSAMYERDAV